MVPGPRIRTRLELSPQAAAAVVAVALTPLVWNPTGLNQFHAPKVLVVSTACLVGVTALLWSDQLRLPPWWRWGVAFLGVLAASAAANGHWRVTVIGYSDRHAGLLMWLMIALGLLLGTGLTRQERQLVSDAVVLAAVLVSLAAMLQMIDVGPFGDTSLSDGRPTATYGSAAYSGAYLATALPLAWVRARTTSGARLRLLAAAAAVFIAVGLALTGSRAAWIGGLGAMAALFWLRPADRRAVGRALAAALFLLGVMVVVAEPLRRRLQGLGLDGSGTVSGRFALWRGIWPTVGERPFLGWGPDRTRSQFPLELPPDFDTVFGSDTIPDRAHNVVGDLAIWGGLAIVVVAFIVAVQIVRSTVGWLWRDDPLSHGLLAATLAYGVHLLFNFPAYELDVSVAVLLGAGLSPASQPVALGDWLRRTLVPVSVSLAILIAIWGGALVASDTAAIRAVEGERDGSADVGGLWNRAVKLSFRDSGMLEAKARSAMRRGDVEAAIRAADQAVDTYGDPYTEELAALVRVNLFASGASNDLTMLEAGSERFESLAERWPTRTSVLRGLAVARYLSGDTVGSIEAVSAAVVLQPDDPALVDYLVRLVREVGPEPGVIEAVEQAIERSPSNPSLLDLRDELESESRGG